MPSYVGLATGAGASGGLETLLARMRADEELKQRGHALDIEQQNANTSAGRLTEEGRQFDAGAPGRQATVDYTGALTRQANATADASEAKGNILTGLNSIVGDSGGDINALNNPGGRLKLSLGGITPSQVFPNDTGDEQVLDAYARKIGKSGRADLTFDDMMAARKLNPAFQQGEARISLSAGNLQARRQELDLRQQMQSLRVQQAQRELAQLPTLQRQMAISEFNNRIAKDVMSQSWSQWLRGDDVPDPGTQIEAIKNDVLSKYGQGSQPGSVASPAAGGDLDEILRQRRAAQGQR